MAETISYGYVENLYSGKVTKAAVFPWTGKVIIGDCLDAYINGGAYNICDLTFFKTLAELESKGWRIIAQERKVAL